MLTPTFLAGGLAVAIAHALQSPLAVTYTVPALLTLHEPVIVSARFQNFLREPIKFDLGWNRLLGFALTVKGPDGQIHRPRITPSDVGRVGRIKVEPNDEFSQILILNTWLPFERPGTYQVEIRLIAPISTESGTAVPAPPPEVMRIDIGERDDAVLRHTCQRLAATVINPAATAAQADERYYAARALGYVRDPVAVPVFRTILEATPYEDPTILEALRKIGTPEAVQVLQDMVARGGDRGALARNALERLKWP
jgi:hypothetical protein